MPTVITYGQNTLVLSGGKTTIYIQGRNTEIKIDPEINNIFHFLMDIP